MDFNWYKSSYRRMLVDMHIPDWNERFLSKYDPKAMATEFDNAHVSSVMMYCQSHVGLCYWPTRTGKMHAGLKGRDIVGELLGELKQRKIPACAYYSVIFNNWAFLEHPEWRMVPYSARPPEAFAGSRYGLCCPNNPEYRAFALAQAEELLTGYDFDGIFFDMTFLPTVCCCEWCRKKWRDESGNEIPQVVDWTEPKWCAFQSARERWIDSFAADLSGHVKKLRPGMPVYHNFAVGFFKWIFTSPLYSAVHHDFLGADFYGDSVEQLFVIKLMSKLSPNRPAEFMTSRCINLKDHVRLKRFETMEMQAYAASLFSAAFLFIDAVDPVGTLNPEIYERIGKIYRDTEVYEPYYGGEPIEDIALYFSNESKMDFWEDGLPLSERNDFGNGFAHRDAIRGVSRILQRAHMPFGVITRKDLPDLSQYKLVVLPNVLRMDDDEVEAFRAYVKKGGRLYASGFTSLTHTSGERKPEFMLADVFGGHFGDLLYGNMYYVRPATDDMRRWIAPQDYMSQMFPAPPAHSTKDDSRATTLALREDAPGKVLGTLTRTYGDPAPGEVFDEKWASIHSSPPWDDTKAPALIRNVFGKGEVVYSTIPFESVDSEANDRLLLAVFESLLQEPLRYGADTHPAVWMNVQHQPEKSRCVVGFLNYQGDLPALPVPQTEFWLRPPAGKRFTRLLHLPGEQEVPFDTDADGTLRATTQNLEVFRLLAAEYQ